jgi:fibronectin type 3 domain-containing protein
MKKFAFTLSLILMTYVIYSQDFALGSATVPENLENSLGSATARPGNSGLPRSVDLTTLFPSARNQGQMNSCVGWATAYALKTYQENKERSWGADSDSELFSPNYIYNQINGGRDQGSSLYDAAELMVNQGVAPLTSFPLTTDYRRQPNSSARQAAASFRNESFRRIDPGNTTAIKTLLADGHGLVFGMKVHESFYNVGTAVYRSYSGAYLGGHAMTLAGYDDSKNAFLIFNSWGTNWGFAGKAWVDYNLFAELTHSVYAIYDQVVTPPVVQEEVVEEREEVLEVLNPPSVVSASNRSYQNKVKVNWSAVAGSDYYEVFRSSQPNQGYILVGQVKGETFFDEGLSPGSRYFYSVRAVNAAGASQFSSIALGLTQERQNDLGIPQNLRGKAEGGLVSLLWDPVQGAASYNVYRWDRSREGFSKVGSSNDTGFQEDLGTASTRAEKYLVTAANSRQESKASNVFSVQILEEQYQWLDTPRVAASQGEFTDMVLVVWLQVQGATSYEISRWNARAQRWEVIGNASGDEFEDTNVSAGKVYYYSVTAVRGSMRSYPADYVLGYVRRYNPAKKRPSFFSDSDYFGVENRSVDEQVEDSSQLFQGDSFFDGDKFFSDFVEEDFFYMDEEAFFAIDEEEFFFVPDDYFEDGDAWFEEEESFF